jgi:hypothetical protein
MHSSRTRSQTHDSESAPVYTMLAMTANASHTTTGRGVMHSDAERAHARGVWSKENKIALTYEDRRMMRVRRMPSAVVHLNLIIYVPCTIYGKRYICTC